MKASEEKVSYIRLSLLTRVFLSSMSDTDHKNDSVVRRLFSFPLPTLLLLSIVICFRPAHFFENTLLFSSPHPLCCGKYVQKEQRDVFNGHWVIAWCKKFS